MPRSTALRFTIAPRRVCAALLSAIVANCSPAPVSSHDVAPVDAVTSDSTTGHDVAGGDGPRCTADIDCSDALYCTGMEHCAPSAAGADARGCVAGVPPCAAGMTCDEGHATCVAADCTPPHDDGDSDGHRSIACGGDDCDDTDRHRYPGNPEVCGVETVGDSGTMLTRTDPAMGLDPAHDEDCNPATFASATTGDGDHDGDGYVDTACANVDDSGMRNHGTDCDDLAMAHGFVGTPAMTTVQPGDIHTMQAEVCNGVDDNCDGHIDEGVLPTYYRDCDGDLYGDSADPGTMECFPSQSAPCMGHGPVTNHTDCNDLVPTINPGAAEVCDTVAGAAGAVDENCDGVANVGCACAVPSSRPCGSGSGGCATGTQTCVMMGTGSNWGTCSVSSTPGTCYADADGDGYAAAGAATSMACVCPAHTTARQPTNATNTDCNDGNASVNPSATEACNGVDDNCNGMIDEGLPVATYYRDADGDGYGGAALTTCNPIPTGYLTHGGDCDDNDSRAFPGQTMYFSTPRTGGGFDFNCNGTEQQQAQPMCALPACNQVQYQPEPGQPACGMTLCQENNCALAFGSSCGIRTIFPNRTCTLFCL